MFVQFLAWHATENEKNDSSLDISISRCRSYVSFSRKLWRRLYLKFDLLKQLFSGQ